MFKCRHCGTPVPVEYDESRVRDDSIRGLLSSVASMLSCDACIDSANNQRAVERAGRHIENLRHSTFNGTAAPIWAMECRFNKAQVVAENRETYKTAYRWDCQRPVWIFGPSGSGKTWLGCAMLHRAIEQRHLPGFRSSADDVELAAHKFDRSKLLQPLDDAGCLLLEDLDKTVWTTKGVGALRYMLDKRKSNNHPTILTSNRPIATVVRVWEGVAKADVVSSVANQLRGLKQLELTNA